MRHCGGGGGGGVTENLWWGHEPSPRSYTPAEGSPITLSNMCVDTKIALYRTTVHVHFIVQRYMYNIIYMFLLETGLFCFQ